MRALRLVPFLALAAFVVTLAAVDQTRAGGPITFTVNDTGDATDANPGNGVCATAGAVCTLRAALQESNAHPAADGIHFNVGAGGVQTILPLSALPGISDAVNIDGTTQPGCASPCIVIDGSGAGSANGLVVSANGSTIRGLVVNSFSAVGVLIVSDDNTLAGNRVGTDAAGMVDKGNSGDGVAVAGRGNVIGGADPDDQNIVSGNGARGVTIEGEQAFDNVVRGNYVGVAADGETPLPNVIGVRLLLGNIGRARVGSTGGGFGNVIGPGNVISGNANEGICICQEGGNLVIGNLIGTDATGTVAVPNGTHGVTIVSSNNTVGGTTVSARNVISGNTEEGVYIQQSVLGPATDNIVRGNYIGTNAAGNADVGNGSIGVREQDAEGTIIGGTAPGARNVISGNGAAVLSHQSRGTVIQGNYIGTDATGMNAVPNDDRQVYVTQGEDVIVGGASAAARNVISGGDFDGMFVASTSGLDIVNNYFGLAADGQTPLGNFRDGIEISGSENSGISIRENAFVDNGSAGIGLYFTSGTEVLGNFVGVTPGGQPMPNGDVGIRVWGGDGSTIGNTSGGGNEVAHNGTDGIEVDGGQSDDRSRVVSAGGPVPALHHTIRGNSIHSNSGIGIDNLNGGNEELAPPVVTAQEFSVAGTACPNCIIDVYSDDEDEGRIYEGTTVADGGGTWAFTEPMTGAFTTATATDGAGNTSEFSDPVVTPEAPTPAPTAEPTAEPTDTPTPTPTAGPSETPVATGTPVPTGTPSGKAIQGDTDCDGDVDSVDGLFVLRDVAGFDPSECIDQGDVDCDEDRDSVDALGILRDVAALPPLVQQEPCADIGTPLD